MRRGFALIPAVLALLVFAAPAAAGTVRLQTECPHCGGGPGLVLVWEGEPGEDNDVLLERQDARTWVLTERAPGARLVAASSDCVVTDRTARCAQPDRNFYAFFYGGDGDDVMSTDPVSGSFDDWFFGGAGNDTMTTGDHGCCIGATMTGGSGDDTFHGGLGVYDEVLYDDRDRAQPVDVSLAARPAGARNGEQGEHDVLDGAIDGLRGGYGDDVLTGDDEMNYITDWGGRDLVHGGGGDDRIFLSSFYEPWGDTVDGEGGDDRIWPGPHPGAIDGGEGVDEVSLDNHAPAWVSELSLDGIADDGGLLLRAPGYTSDRVVPQGNVVGVENIAGNDDTDLLIGDDGANRLLGEGGDDILVAGAGHDVVDADGWEPPGADFIFVLDGESDRVTCGGGDDVVVFDPSLDELSEDCETLIDHEIPVPELDIPPPPAPPATPELPPVIIESPPVPDASPALPPVLATDLGELPRVVVTAPAQACFAMRCIRGSGGADRLVGTASRERLDGRGGVDVLVGGGGADVLLGGGGSDRLRGQAGRDLLVGGTGADRIDGGPGADYVIAADGRRDVVDCGTGQDVALVDEIDRVRNCRVLAAGPPAG